ncbi:MAG: hypothetical protein PVI40_04825 [Chlamydiota bacterium]|jgi:hypothetical protein
MNIAKLFDAAQVASASVFFGSLVRCIAKNNNQSNGDIVSNGKIIEESMKALSYSAITYMAASLMSYPFRSYDDSNFGNINCAISTAQIISTGLLIAMGNSDSQKIGKVGQVFRQVVDLTCFVSHVSAFPLRVFSIG